MKSNPARTMKACLLSLAVLPVTGALAQFTPPPTNASPEAQIVSPYEGKIFLVGDNIQLCAASLYFTDKVASVEFFAGTSLVGVATNSPESAAIPVELFCVTWSNASVGEYALTAVATDVGGISVTSPAVDISVVSNLPPRVHITSPENGEKILNPTNLDICASAYDPDGTVVSVEFFEGTTSLGTVPTPPIIYATNRFGVFPIHSPYCITVSNVMYGTFTLTAVATDNGGLTATSAPVTISIVSNLPPRVQIVRPEEDSFFLNPANIDISAFASQEGGSISSVQFFEGTNSLGVVTTPITITNWGFVQDLYSLVWSNAPVGKFTLTAVADGAGGLSSTSRPVNISVVTNYPHRW